VPISLLITVSFCVLLLAAVVIRRRRPGWRSAQPSEAPRQPRSRPRLGLAVSGIASEEAIMEAAANQALDPAGDETRFAGLAAEPEPVDVDAIPLAEVGAATAIWTAEVIDAPGWPQPGELDPGGDPANAESGPMEDGQAAFEVNLPTLAVAGEDDTQNKPREAWTASSDSFDPATAWDDATPNWTAPDALPADWGTPTVAGDGTLVVTADETEASWDGTILHDRSRDRGAAWSPDWNAPATSWDDGLVADTGAEESVWEIPTISTGDPTGGEAAGATRVTPEPETGPLVVDPSGGAAGVTAHLLGASGQTRLDPAVAAAVELAVAAGLTRTPPGPVVVVIATEGGQVRSQREERLARKVRRLERKLQALVLEGAPQLPQPSRPSRPRRSTEDQPVLRLSAVEERELRTLARRRSAPARVRRRARIVLATARGLDVTAIARRVGVHRTTVRRWQQRFAEQRLAAITGPSGAAPARQRSR